MRILGIDYGKKKIGLAIATSIIAAPYRTIKFVSEKELFEKLNKIVKSEKIERVVVGVSEGEMGESSRDFGERLEKELGLSVVYQDETLTTLDAQALSLEAQVGRKKRKELEDAYSAALILQGYLESK